MHTPLTLTEQLALIEQLQSSSPISFHQPLIKPLIEQYPDCNVLFEILQLQPPIDRVKIDTLVTFVDNELHRHKFSSEVANSIWRKLYSQVVIGCTIQRNQTDGEVYLTKLLHLIQHRKHIEQVLYFFFAITSLVALVDYSIQSNREYKYSQFTKVLFFYLLAQLKPTKKQYLYQLCEEIMAREPRKASKKQGILGCIEESIKNKTKDFFLEKTIKLLIVKERQVIGESKKNEGADIKLIVSSYILNKWGLELKSTEDFNKLLSQNQDLVKILKLITNNSHLILSQELLNTNLIKKIATKARNRLIAEKQADPARYAMILQQKGMGDIEKYRRCKEGSYLRKCNFNNKQIHQKFVRIGEDGIYWGKDDKDCTLKFRWEKIKGVLYGNRTANFNCHFKYLSGEKCFSLYLKRRTLDFVCSSREEVLLWVQGIAFILNKFRQGVEKQSQNMFERRIIQTRGLLLWSELLIRVRLQGQPWEMKGRGIAKIGQQQRKVKTSV